MSDTKLLICPICKSNSFSLKYEATYVYSYIIDSDAPGLNNTEEFLPFMYDNREQKETKQFLECNTCGSIYKCYFNQWDKKIGIKDLQAAISSSSISQVSFKAP
jgi:hypothetical protein